MPTYNLYSIRYSTDFTSVGKKVFKMGFSSEIFSHCTQNSLDSCVHATWHCTPIKHFWKEITESLSLFLGCHIPLSPLTLLTRRHINNQPEQNKQQITPRGSNYHRENYPHELEIKGHHTYCTLKKLTHRIHLFRKCIHRHQQYCD